MKNKNISKKLIVSGSALLFLIVGGVGLVYIQKDRSVPENNWVDGVNYGPPTKEDRRAGEQQERIIADQEGRRKQNKSHVSQTGSKQKVPVIITDAGQYDGIIEVRSFVPEHTEDGSCKITFQNGSQSFTKNMPAKKDISSTVCMDPQLNLSIFPSGGVWQVSVTYDSLSAEGKSESKKLNIEK